MGQFGSNRSGLHGNRSEISDNVLPDSENALIIKIPQTLEEFRRERDALELLQADKRVVRLLKSDDTNRELHLLAAPGETLEQLIKYDSFTEAEANQIVHQVALTLNYIHNQGEDGFVHYDISPSNILWDRAEQEVTVIDFGTAYRLKDIPTEYSEHPVGTPLYMAPEKLDLQPELGKASDIFSVGAIWYELISGSPPFDPALGNIKEQIKRCEPYELRRVSPEVGELIQRMLSKDASLRPTASEVVNWFEERASREERSA